MKVRMVGHAEDRHNNKEVVEDALCGIGMSIRGCGLVVAVEMRRA
jgi:hypothetical protein